MLSAVDQLDNHTLFWAISDCLQLVRSRGLNAVDSGLDHFTKTRRALKMHLQQASIEIFSLVLLVNFAIHVRTPKKEKDKISLYWVKKALPFSPLHTPHLFFFFSVFLVQQIQLQRAAMKNGWVCFSFTRFFHFPSLIPSFSFTAVWSCVAVVYLFCQ